MTGVALGVVAAGGVASGFVVPGRAVGDELGTADGDVDPSGGEEMGAGVGRNGVAVAVPPGNGVCVRVRVSPAPERADRARRAVRAIRRAREIGSERVLLAGAAVTRRG